MTIGGDPLVNDDRMNDVALVDNEVINREEQRRVWSEPPDALCVSCRNDYLQSRREEYVGEGNIYAHYKLSETDKERDVATFAFMPARNHPVTKRNRFSEGWTLITAGVTVVLVAGVILAFVASSGSALRDIGAATVSGALIGLVILYGDKRVDKAQDQRDMSSDARNILISNSKGSARGLPADTLDLYAVDVKDFFLMDASFDRADLRMARFTNCNVRFASFEKAKLINSWLAFCDATGANFVKADMRFSTCSFTTFNNAVLKGADLTFAAFPGASFKGADLTEAILRDAFLAGADLSEVTGLDIADLHGVHFDDTTLWPEGFKPPQSDTSAT